jgi:uncharacterized protein
MNQPLVPIEVRGIVKTAGGYAIFIGNSEKVFVIQVEHGMGQVIEMFLRGTPKERPLTHDLMLNIFTALGVVLERVVISELKGTTYFARLVLKQENELGKSFAEVDARPSDCLALACALRRPIFVGAALFESVEDMSGLLREINGESED